MLETASPAASQEYVGRKVEVDPQNLLTGRTSICCSNNCYIENLLNRPLSPFLFFFSFYPILQAAFSLIKARKRDDDSALFSMGTHSLTDIYIYVYICIYCIYVYISFLLWTRKTLES